MTKGYETNTITLKRYSVLRTLCGVNSQNGISRKDAKKTPLKERISGDWMCKECGARLS